MSKKELRLWKSIFGKLGAQLFLIYHTRAAPFPEVRRKTIKESFVNSNIKVRFKELTEDEIRFYVKTGEPLDKAGGYAIQGLASLFVERIEGDFWNVVGFPLQLFYRILKEHFGVDLLSRVKYNVSLIG